MTDDFPAPYEDEFTVALDKIANDLAVLREAHVARVKLQNISPLPIIAPCAELKARERSKVEIHTRNSRKATRIQHGTNVTLATARDSVLEVRAIIGRANAPVPISVLTSEVLKKGFIIDTENPRRTLGARLRDYSGEIGLVFKEGQGWWLKEREKIAH